MKQLRIMAAVAAIVIGAVTVLLINNNTDPLHELGLVSFAVALAVVNIVLGALLLRNKKNQTQAIALFSTVLVCAMYFLSQVTRGSRENFTVTYWFLFVVCLGLIGCLSFYLGTLNKFWDKDGNPINISTPYNFEKKARAIKLIRLIVATTAVFIGGAIAIACLINFGFFQESSIGAIFFLVSVAIIVIGALIFRDAKNKSTAITLIVLCSVLGCLLFLCLLITTSWLYPVEGMPSATSTPRYANTFEWIMFALTVINICLSSLFIGKSSTHWAVSESSVDSEVSEKIVQMQSRNGNVLRLAAGIIAIVAGVLFVAVSPAPGHSDGSELSGFLLHAIALIVLGALMFRKRKNKGIAIAILVISSFITLFLIPVVLDTANNYSTQKEGYYFEMFLLSLNAANIIVTSFYLAGIKKYWGCTAKVVPQTEMPAAVAVANQTPTVLQEFTNNIVILKQMKQAGTLTEKEFKDILAREVDKFVKHPAEG